tara:strand:- start:153 stop:329 length:177 start_codon:yes stop_codon:yes gene_type:complete
MTHKRGHTTHPHYDQLTPAQKKRYGEATKGGAPGGTGLGTKIYDFFNSKSTESGSVND